MKRRTIILWVVLAAVAVATAALLLRLHQWKPTLATIQGAVVRLDPDPERESPVAGAVVTASRGDVSASTISSASGYFKIVFPEVIWPGQIVDISFSQSDFKPLTLHLQMTFRSTSRRLIVAAMKPLALQVVAPSGKPAGVVSNVRIRYTVNSETEENVGSAVKTFQIVNQGDVPCRDSSPCSPDGDWKAATTTVTMDAGFGNLYRDVRASCIAGPCPFTRIYSGNWEHGGRTIAVTAEDWSDTTTFLLEAEVFSTTNLSNVRESYPVIFDRTLNFTLPPTQEGASIEAEIDGTPLVFPLGPDIYLSWADCNVRTNQEGEKSTVYQCQLKPSYRF